MKRYAYVVRVQGAQASSCLTGEAYNICRTDQILPAVVEDWCQETGECPDDVVVLAHSYIDVSTWGR